MGAGAELDDERLAALRTLLGLAVDQHFRIRRLHAQRE